MADEQEGSLPVATFANGHELGEVKIIRTEPADYHVIWYPPEVHVGQDLIEQQATDEEDVVDVGALPPRQTVARILAFGEKMSR